MKIATRDIDWAKEVFREVFQVVDQRGKVLRKQIKRKGMAKFFAK